MTSLRRWADWLRALTEIDRTPEELLSARLDAIEKQLEALTRSRKN